MFERLRERGCDWRFAATSLPYPPEGEAPADVPAPAIVRAYHDVYGQWPAHARD